MRLAEILNEDYNSNLNADLNNILIGAKSSGITQLRPEVVVRQMQRMGYSIDTNSLISMLQDNPVVQNATPTAINLTSDNVNDSDFMQDDNQEHNADKVNSMAQAATSKELKK